MLVYTIYPIIRGDILGTVYNDYLILDISHIASSIFNCDYFVAKYGSGGKKCGLFRQSRAFKSKPVLLSENNFELDIRKMIVLPTGKQPTLLMLSSGFHFFLTTNINSSRKKNKKPVCTPIAATDKNQFICNFFTDDPSPNCPCFMAASVSSNSLSFKKYSIVLKSKSLKLEIAHEVQNIQCHSINDICCSRVKLYVAATEGIFVFDMITAAPLSLITEGKYSSVVWTLNDTLFAISDNKLVSICGLNGEKVIVSGMRSGHVIEDGDFQNATTRIVRSISSVGESVIMSDNSSIRIITNANKLKWILTFFADLAKMFGYMPIHDSRNITLEAAMQMLPTIRNSWESNEMCTSTSFLREGESDYRGLDSTHGVFTKPSRHSVAQQLEMFLNIYTFAVMFSLEEKILMKYLTEVYVERYFSAVGLVSQNPNALSMLEFSKAASKIDLDWFKQQRDNKSLTGELKNRKHYSSVNDSITDRVNRGRAPKQLEFECITREHIQDNFRTTKVISGLTKRFYKMAGSFGRGHKTSKVRSYLLKWCGTRMQLVYLAAGYRTNTGGGGGGDEEEADVEKDDVRMIVDSHSAAEVEKDNVRMIVDSHSAADSGLRIGGDGHSLHIIIPRSAWDECTIEVTPSANNAQELNIVGRCLVAYWLDSDRTDQSNFNIALFVKTNEHSVTLQSIDELDKPSVDIPFEISTDSIICLLPPKLHPDDFESYVSNELNREEASKYQYNVNDGELNDIDDETNE